MDCFRFSVSSVAITFAKDACAGGLIRPPMQSSDATPELEDGRSLCLFLCNFLVFRGMLLCLSRRAQVLVVSPGMLDATQESLAGHPIRRKTLYERMTIR